MKIQEAETFEELCKAESQPLTQEEWQKFKEENKHILDQFNSYNPLCSNYECVPESSSKQIFNKSNYESWSRIAFGHTTYRYKIKSFFYTLTKKLNQFFCFHDFEQKFPEVIEFYMCKKCCKYKFKYGEEDVELD